MTTRILKAQMGIITDEMREIAKHECVTPKFIRDSIAQGQIVILKNKLNSKTKPIAIGKKLKTKISACISANSDKNSLNEETDKFRIIQYANTDCVFDLSYGSYIQEAKQILLTNSTIPIGTSPMLQVGYEFKQNNEDKHFSKDEIFSLIKKDCMEGVDIICLNCALTKSLVKEYESQKRLSEITTKEAQFLYDWINITNCENPFYEYFDELLEILKENDVTLLINTAFKTGTTSDSFDSLQISEYATISKLIKKANEKGVQAIVDGIGYTPINKIEPLITMIKEMTNNVPIFISKANSCDCAIGYDNISASIANSLCAQYGANMINAVANVDTLKSPSPSELKEAIISAKIAANSADLANGNSDIIKQNYKVSYAKQNKSLKNIIKNSIDKSAFEGINSKHQ